MRNFVAVLSERFPLIYSLCTNRLPVALAWLALLFVVTSYGRFAELVITTDGLVTKLGPMIGGDFVVFRSGALATGTSEMISYYQIENFAAMLRKTYPGQGKMMFAWPYPPTMFLLVKPLSLFSFIPSYVLWVATFGALFVATVWRLWTNRLALFFAVASPAVFLAIITGQTGLLTASLIALCGFYADRRPILAGIAAGILTVKPQLGILVPVALAAGGHWRAFVFAGASTLLLAAASVLSFGIELWPAFVQELLAHGELAATATRFPVGKLNTPFGAASVLGAPANVALLVQAGVSLALATFVFAAWRRVASVELRLAALATAAPLATPYGFYYEMSIYVPAMVVLAKHATECGWLKGERFSLILLWGASFLPPGSSTIPSFPLSFVVALLAFVIAARRVVPALARTRANVSYFSPQNA